MLLMNSIGICLEDTDVKNVMAQKSYTTLSLKQITV